MNRKELDALIGLPEAEAVAKVKAAGLEPLVCQTHTIRTAIAFAGNVVDLVLEKGVVVCAETQASIDAKHSRD